MIWQILDANSIWVKEFASALAQRVPVVSWVRDMSLCGVFGRSDFEEILKDPPLRIRHFSLQRGYSRFPVSWCVRLGDRQTQRMTIQAGDPAQSPLVCTTPYYAPVAERWSGPVVYYQTDLTAAYDGANPKLVRVLDQRMCRVASAVCPNSRRIAEYMVREAGCAEEKIHIVPNATRASNILGRPPEQVADLPADIADLPRPIAGVTGNLAANMDWELLADAIARTPEFTWVFVGPTTMKLRNARQREARARLLEGTARVRFTGSKPYSMLQQYARAFDAAVLPYHRHEPTYSGSSTRFYEHLAACRPMVATRGFEELLHKEPLLRLVDTGAELAAELNRLREIRFEDGLAEARWRASLEGTWDNRAAAVVEALHQRWQPKSGTGYECEPAEAEQDFAR
jgi:glycosyltransferase involved in cell wall biosynthesis